MDINLARQTLLDAGIKLVNEGLVARTWGNISCRIDENSFLITPSGRSYDQLTLDDFVLVQIEDLSYPAGIKPSSEKGVHAEVYKNRPEVTAVIHTHQMNASTCAASRKDVPATDQEFKKILGDVVRCAGYGLPGTKKLKLATSKALGDSNAALMANHGAVCVGKTMDEAFLVAKTLEKKCEEFIFSEFANISGIKTNKIKNIHDFYILKKKRGKK
ncbi:MAG: class II aldolase/adducin family protein [Spirochaetales bacterium]|nr:class II aldolase/adducin family protein [Spirochaetales bacterium]